MAGNTGSTVGGGVTNRATGSWATIAGGTGNLASHPSSTVAGGSNNVASHYVSTVGGGESNGASGYSSAIAGGFRNVASGQKSVVGGGWANEASAAASTVSGGRSNRALDDYATVPGGVCCSASGVASLAAGTMAKAGHDGTFVWGDSTDACIHSGDVNQFIVRANGGLWFGAITETFTVTIDSGVFISTTTGAYLSDGGVWTDASDVNGKTDIAPVVVAEVLATLLELPISTWKPVDSPSVEHMGPMAQDFYAAFGLGRDDRHIASLDLAGAAVAAIQGMHAEMDELRVENAELRRRLEALEAGGR